MEGFIGFLVGIMLTLVVLSNIFQADNNALLNKVGHGVVVGVKSETGPLTCYAAIDHSDNDRLLKGPDCQKREDAQ